MLTGNPPLSHLEPVVATFWIALRPIVPTLPWNVSQDAKEFVMAALTWLVLLKAGLNKWLFSQIMYVKKLCLKAC